MAVQPYVVLVENTAGGIWLVQWTLGNGDVGRALPSWSYSDITVQVSGTFGTGGAVRPEGSNFVDQSAFFQLRDPGLTLISFTSADGKQIMEHTYLIRPRCTAGDGSTAIIVVMSLSSTGRRS